MKKLQNIAILLAAFVLLSFSQEEKLISKSGHIKFYSHTPVEDITANNYKVTSSFDKNSGVVIYSVPMQSFEFENATMQKHFNNKKFLNTKKYPKAKFKGTIQNFSLLDLSKDTSYQVSITGQMTIKDVTKPVTENGTITIKQGVIETNSTMNLTLADYGITFKRGKPAKNVAKTIEVTAHVKYL